MKRIIRYTSVYLKNSDVRLNVAALFGLILNALYIIFNFVFGIIHGDAWLIAVGAYYFLIFSVRFILIRDDAPPQVSDGVRLLMAALGVPITGMIIYSVLTSGTKKYGVAILPIFFVYTVYSVLRAAFGIKRSKMAKNANHQTLHTLRLSAAFMSLFNFQISLLSFVSLRYSIEMILNFLTGAVVSLSVFAMSKRTVPKSQREE